MSGPQIYYPPGGGGTGTAAADGVNIVSAGTQVANTTGTVKFADSNGVTFGMSNNSVVTATVKTDYQTSGNYLTTAQPVGNYLTTARASNDAIGLNTAKTNATWTINSSGFSFDGGAYLTTAQPVGVYLTTARASNDAIGLNTAATSVTWTVNSSGISLNAGAYLTTAALSNHSHGNPTLALTNLTGTTASASNGLTLSLSANPAQTNQNISLYALGNTTQNSSTLLNASNLSINAIGSLTAGYSNGSIQLSAPNALTTAMASNRGTDFVQANAVFNGTNASGTIASNAISISVAAPGGGGGPTIKGSGAQTQSTGTVEFANSNGITFGLSNNGTMTASHNGLTTARASNDAVGLNTAQTNVTWTVNSSGISLNAGAYLTTAMASNAATISNINLSAGTTSLNLSKMTFADSNGISFGLSGNSVITGTVKTDYQSSNANYLTSQSNQALSGSNGSFAFQTATFGNLNGISFYTSNNSLVASHNALTTARASNDAIGLNTAQSNVTWTANSSGLSLDARGYAGTGTSATNASVTLNSNGLAISVAAPGGSNTPAVSNSAGSFTFSTLNFSNANNVTWGTSAGGIVTASVAAPGAAAENNNHNLLGANTAGNTTASGSTIGLSGINITLSGTNGSAINISAPATSSLSATGQVSLSTNGSTISIGVPGAVTYSRYNEFKESPKVAGEIGNGSLHMQPWLIPNLQFDCVVLHKGFSNATNSSFSFTVSDFVGIYTKNGSTLSLLQSTSISTNFSGSGTAGSYLSYGGGIKAQTIGMTNTLTEGMYWIGVVQRTTTGGGAGHTLNQILNSQINSSYRGLMGAATNATNQMSTGFGVYTVTTSGMPNSIGITELQGNSSVFLRPPSLYFVSGTV